VRARGVRGLAIRVAKAINRRLGRRGRVWADRFHARLLRTRIEKTPDGDYNLGRYSNPKVDEAVDKLKTEIDGKKRAELARTITKLHMDDVGHIPLHFQVIPWAMRSNVSVIHRADNRLTVQWVKIQ